MESNNFKKYIFLKAINDVNGQYCELHQIFLTKMRTQKYPKKTSIIILYGRFKLRRRTCFEPYLVEANAILNKKETNIKYSIHFHSLIQQAYFFLNLFQFRLQKILKS